MMKIKNISKRRIRIGKDNWIHPSEVITIPDDGGYLLTKHTELVDITPKPVIQKKPVKIQVLKSKPVVKQEPKKEIEVNKYDIK